MKTKEEQRKERLFRKQLAQMPTEYLICHDQRVGHAWQPATLDTPDGNFSLGLTCTRCSLECEVVRSPLTGKSERRYWHPHGDQYYFTGAGMRTREQRLDIEQAWQRDMLGRLPKARD